MRLALLLALALLLGGCAWSNRSNRPTWNAFEEHLVPESDGAFWAALPLTVPGGLVAILADTFVVHPAQVVDDAWGDSAELWQGVDWRGEYFTQLGVLPFRVVGTPLVFVGSFLGRSAFDVPTDEDQQDRDARRDAAEAERERRLIEAFEVLASGTEAPVDFDLPDAPHHWTPELQAAFERALRGASAPGRRSLLLHVRNQQLAPWISDPALGLRDSSAVIRHDLLLLVARRAKLPQDVIDALLEDPDPVVRALARSRWP